MTLEEKIEQEKLQIEENWEKLAYAVALDNQHLFDTCLQNIEEHEQLAEWLEELKKRRSEDYGYMADIHQSIGYRKALDDFVETLVSAFDETNIKEYGFYPENLVRQVAKQLKGGN